MAFNIKATMEAVHGYLLASGYFAQVQVGEPKQPPREELAASIFMDAVSVASLTLGTTIERHVLTVRLYRDMLSEPQQEIEYDLAMAVSQISGDLLGDYDLGATIRNVDAAGQHGPPMGASWGYAEVGGVMYRVVDLLVPLIVDDSAMPAP